VLKIGATIYNLRGVASAAAIGASLGIAMPSVAAEPMAPQGLTADEEIIVTARRRDETLTAVPVAITAMTQTELQRAGVTDFRSLSSALPTLKTSEATSGAGGSIYIRGVGTTGGLSAGSEQAVSINVDGVQFSRGSILRLGLYDAAQVQVLRGPQALFFGKNSPAGVISVTTADPGDRFEISGRASYEFEARTIASQFAVSGPITDTLGARVFVNVDKSDGYFINDAGTVSDAINAIRPGTAFTLGDDRGPYRRSVFVRGTLKFEPSSVFDARLKTSYSYQNQDNASDYKQKIACSAGVSQVASTVSALGGNPALTPLLAIDDCRPNRHFTHGTLPQSTAALALGNLSVPNTLGKASILLGSLEMNLEVAPAIKLTSVTGYEKTKDYFIDSFSWNPAYLSALTFETHNKDHSFTQELRLATNFTGFPVNFLVGGFYQDAGLFIYNYNAPSLGARFDQRIGTRAASIFGQAIWNITKQIELSGGARYSTERKTFSVERAGVPQPTLVPKNTYHDLSPELTLTFRPSQLATFYATYKQGFKSGGFNPRYNSGNPIAAPGDDVSFAPESTSGGEIGAKAELLDRSIRIALAVYNYKYQDLQVSSVDNSTAVATIRVQNAATARSKGVEWDMTYSPRLIEGMRFNSSINYSNARYLQFTSPCYVGQTIAEGCNLVPAGNGRFTSQELSGRRLTNSAEWSIAFGTSYEVPISSGGWMLGFAADTKHESAYNPLPEQDPLVAQRGYWLVNGSVRVFSDKGRWEFAVIGRNLTNVYRAIESTSASFTGNGALTGTATTGGRPDYTGNLLAPRSIMAQASFKF
jgi:iron complex outermembrane receptor protein